jgi:hypothetical protein
MNGCPPWVTGIGGNKGCHHPYGSLRVVSAPTLSCCRPIERERGNRANLNIAFVLFRDFSIKTAKTVGVGAVTAEFKLWLQSDRSMTQDQRDCISNRRKISSMFMRVKM